MEAGTFFRALFTVIMFLGLFLGLLYWLTVLFNKYYPNFKWWAKYKLLRRPMREDLVLSLMEYAQKDTGEDEMIKDLLLNSKITPKEKIKEILYIYAQIKNKLKGGK